MAVTRRDFATLFGGALLAGCGRAETSTVRLHARPGKVATAAPAGIQALHLRDRRDAMLYIPEALPAEHPAPLLVYLHGATGDEQQGIRRMKPYADQFQFVLLSPASEAGTWDAIRDAYGPDVRHL